MAILKHHGFPGHWVVKNLLANAGDVGSRLVWKIAPADENGNSLQYSCLGNPMAGNSPWVHK